MKDEKERFVALVDALAVTKDVVERNRLKDELARITFRDGPRSTRESTAGLGTRPPAN
jgi:hypothetical protein